MSEHSLPAKPERRRSWRKGGIGVRLPVSRSARRVDQAPQYRRFDTPDGGTEITDRVTLFHDATDGLFTCTVGSEPWIRLTLYQFAGSYLSLAVGLRKSDLRQLRPGIVMAFRLDATASRPLAVFARLNLRSAEQTQTLYETIILHETPHDLRFELDGARVPFSDVSAGWIDLIFSDPSMREIDIRAMAVSFSKARANG